MIRRERIRRLESVKYHLSPFDVIFMRTPLGTIGVFRSARARRVVVIVEWYEVGTKHFSVSAKSDLSACQIRGGAPYCFLNFLSDAVKKCHSADRSMHFTSVSNTILASS